MAYLCDSYEAKGLQPSYADLANAAAIPDAEIFAAYPGVCFTPGDLPE